MMASVPLTIVSVSFWKLLTMLFTIVLYQAMTPAARPNPVVPLRPNLTFCLFSEGLDAFPYSFYYSCIGKLLFSPSPLFMLLGSAVILLLYIIALWLPLSKLSLDSFLNQNHFVYRSFTAPLPTRTLHC